MLAKVPRSVVLAERKGGNPPPMSPGSPVRATKRRFMAFNTPQIT
jgi:hypothetical protein